MNTFKANLLILTLGLITSACSAEGSDSTVDQSTVAQPSATPESDVCPKSCLDKIAEVRGANQALKTAIDEILNNPAYKAVKWTTETATHAYDALTKKLAIIDAKYKQHLCDSPYQTVAMTIGAALIGTALGITSLAVFIAEMNRRDWNNRRQKWQEEDKRWQEEQDHAWVQKQRGCGQYCASTWGC
jgi:hypothetical protein